MGTETTTEIGTAPTNATRRPRARETTAVGAAWIAATLVWAVGGLLAVAAVTVVVTAGVSFGIEGIVRPLIVWLAAIAVGGTVGGLAVRTAARVLATRSGR